MVQRRKRRTSLRGREEELTTLWNCGLSDGQIAGRVGCTAGAVQHWRRRNDLPRNWERGRPRGEWAEGFEKTGRTAPVLFSGTRRDTSQFFPEKNTKKRSAAGKMRD